MGCKTPIVDYIVKLITCQRYKVATFLNTYMCWCKAIWWKVQSVQFPLSSFLWANDDGGDCQYLLNTMCQVLFLGSRRISSFTSLWSNFSLIYRWEIWLDCNLHGKEKNIHPLPECPVSVSLAFYFPCPYIRTLPNILFNIPFVCWFYFLLFMSSFILQLHCPGKLGCTGLIAIPFFFPSLPTSHTQLNGSAGPSNWTKKFFTRAWQLLSLTWLSQ